MSELLKSVATMTKASKKATKAEAHRAVISLIEELDKKDIKEETKIAARDAYSFFMPTVRKAKDEFDLLRLFRGKKDVRHYLNYIYSDGNYLQASNGHVAIRFPTILAEGYYDDALNPVDVDWKFPNIERVMASSSGKDYQKVGINDLTATPSSGVYVFELNNGAKLDVAYVNPILSVAPVLFCFNPRDPMDSVRVCLDKHGYEGVEITIATVRP